MKPIEQYQADWSSLSRHPLASWFSRAKFGIYTHWGPYAVPAYGRNGTWYPNKMYIPGTPEHVHHTRTYGDPRSFGYKDFIPLFKGEKFDADEWAELFAKAGAKFAGPVAEHHDGFAMWDSRVTEWNAARMGPRRDVVGALERAVRAQGLKFLTTFHHAYNWWFFNAGKATGDCARPEFRQLYAQPHGDDEWPDDAFLDRWRDKLYEVIAKYRPDMIWFDFCLGRIRERYRREFLAHYYNRALAWQREVVVTYKQMPKGNYHLPPLSAVMDLEVGKMNELTPYPWLTDTSVDASPDGAWSHVRDVGFKSVERLVHNLVDLVSKNGHLLLNVGPRADGTIPEGARETLLGLGKWLSRNGEAIYDTVPWFVAGEGPTKAEGGGHFNETNEARFTAHDIRFTSRKNTLYAICLGRPGEEVRMATFKDGHFLYPGDIASITMLGTKQGLKWRLDDTGLVVETPRRMPCDHAYAFKITLREGSAGRNRTAGPRRAPQGD
ncbi:MAG: alpha-L-fucosidase [Opitutaceae bacterium]|nr:alpha-L-fucosidase [Opitutaceae bacterium]